jgi:hypothetical protein
VVAAPITEATGTPLAATLTGDMPNDVTQLILY